MRVVRTFAMLILGLALAYLLSEGSEPKSAAAEAGMAGLEVSR